MKLKTLLETILTNDFRESNSISELLDMKVLISTDYEFELEPESVSIQDGALHIDTLPDADLPWIS
jgi:hypothetical protein